MMFYTKNYLSPLGEQLSAIVYDDGVICKDISDSSYDYANYLAWVAEGNTAEEWSPDDAS